MSICIISHLRECVIPKKSGKMVISSERSQMVQHFEYFDLNVLWEMQ